MKIAVILSECQFSAGARWYDKINQCIGYLRHKNGPLRVAF